LPLVLKIVASEADKTSIQQGFYRHAKSTLKARSKKTLLERTTWFREKRKRSDIDDNDDGEDVWIRGDGWCK
jgi:hypothetical protein